MYLLMQLFVTYATGCTSFRYLWVVSRGVYSIWWACCYCCNWYDGLYWFLLDVGFLRGSYSDWCAACCCYDCYDGSCWFFDGHVGVLLVVAGISPFEVLLVECVVGQFIRVVSVEGEYIIPCRLLYPSEKFCG